MGKESRLTTLLHEGDHIVEAKRVQARIARGLQGNNRMFVLEMVIVRSTSAELAAGMQTSFVVMLHHEILTRVVLVQISTAFCNDAITHSVARVLRATNRQVLRRTFAPVDGVAVEREMNTDAALVRVRGAASLDEATNYLRSCVVAGVHNELMALVPDWKMLIEVKRVSYNPVTNEIVASCRALAQALRAMVLQ